MDFEDLTILSWNIRGALSLEGRRHAKELVRKHHPLFIFLMEIHCPFSKTSIFWNRLGYEICALSEASSHSGGIWVLKSKGCDYDITVIDAYFHAVTICIKKSDCMWFCSAIYGSPQLVNREKLWSYLISIREDILSPWVMIGDFNEVIHPSEIKEGIFTARQAEKLSNMMEQCNLIDLGATCSIYT